MISSNIYIGGIKIFILQEQPIAEKVNKNNLCAMHKKAALKK